MTTRTKPHVDDAPGLVWRFRKNRWVAYWQARSDLVKRGYPVGAVHLWEGENLTPTTAHLIASECREQQLVMRTWGHERDQSLRQGRSTNTIETRLSRLQTRIRRKVKKMRVRNAVGFIYFFRNSSGIKIGFTMDMEHRYYQLQNGSADVLERLGMIPGTYSLEKEIHARFGPMRIRGEWYRNDPKILEYIKIATI